MKNKKLINWLALSGVISVIFYILHDIIGGINYPGYNSSCKRLNCNRFSSIFYSK